MNNSKNTYTTEDLPFAAYLHVTKRLKFIGCERGDRRVAFLFSDPQGEGEALFIAYLDGAEAPTARFYESIKLLRKLMDARTGSEHGHRFNR